MGLPPTPEDVHKLHEVSEVQTSDRLQGYLEAVAKDAAAVLALPGVKLDLDGTLNTHILQDAIEEARVAKTDYELECIAKANEISCKAHETLIRKARELKSEYEAGALFEYICKHEGYV